MKEWQETEDGKKYCSDHCFEKTLLKCLHCGRPLRQWIVTDNGTCFCDQNCLDSYNPENRRKISLEPELSSAELAYLTGLSESDCIKLMEANHINGDEALAAIDIYMQSQNDNITPPVEIVACMKNAGIYSKLSERLSAYNTMRGGTKGYGGFVFEELHAADAASKGANINVIADNGPADFIVRNPSGKKIFVQAKAGYKPGQIDWAKYKGQTIVVDKGNTALASEARAAGLNVQESAVYKQEANLVARFQQWESKVTGKTTAPIIGTATGAHYSGMASMKLAARVGVSMKLGATIFDVISQNRNFSDAAGDLVIDSAKVAGGAYASGVAFSLASTAATTLASTTAGTAVTAAASAAVSAVASTVGTTSAGAACVSGATAVASYAVAAVTSITSAPLLPVVGVCAAIGFGCKMFKKMFS